MILLTWFRAVFSLISSAQPICLLVSPFSTGLEDFSFGLSNEPEICDE